MPVTIILGNEYNDWCLVIPLVTVQYLYTIFSCVVTLLFLSKYFFTLQTNNDMALLFFNGEYMTF